MVSNGLGISIMPELMTRHSVHPVLQRPLEQAFYRNIALCVKHEKTCSLSTRRFIEHVKRWVHSNQPA